MITAQAERFTHVSNTIEPHNGWYCVRYMVADTFGEYVQTRKFTSYVDAVAFIHEVSKTL